MFLIKVSLDLVRHSKRGIQLKQGDRIIILIIRNIVKEVMIMWRQIQDVLQIR
jgi:hypothetical protein